MNNFCHVILIISSILNCFTQLAFAENSNDKLKELYLNSFLSLNDFKPQFKAVKDLRIIPIPTGHLLEKYNCQYCGYRTWEGTAKSDLESFEEYRFVFKTTTDAKKFLDKEEVSIADGLAPTFFEKNIGEKCDIFNYGFDPVAKECRYSAYLITLEKNVVLKLKAQLKPMSYKDPRTANLNKTIKEFAVASLKKNLELYAYMENKKELFVAPEQGQLNRGIRIRNLPNATN
jgi:hypothetical protein